MVDVKKAMEVFDDIMGDLGTAYAEELSKVQIELNEIDEKTAELEKKRWAIKSDVLHRSIKNIEEKYKILL